MTLYRRRRRWLDKILLIYVTIIACLLITMCGCLLGILIVLARAMETM